MSVFFDIQSSGALPVVENTQRQTVQNVGEQQTSQQRNQYTAGQQLLQDQSTAFISNLLSGGSAPASMGLPQSAYDAAFYNLNKYQIPQLSAQFGAGSPAINSAMQELNLNLAALAGQNSMSNSLSAYNLAAEYSLRPVGSNEQSAGVRQTTEDMQQSTQGIDYGGALEAVLQLLLPAQTFP